MRVLITGARAPAALHLARLLHGAGHHVVMADGLRRTVSGVSRACAAFVHLPAANGDAGTYATAIRSAITTHEISLVIPTCEEVFHLAAIWADTPMGAPLFAPELATVLAAHNKYTFIETAKTFGLPVPQTRLLTSAQDLEAVRHHAASLVFKPVWSRFARDVLIRPERITFTPIPERPWVAQDFVAGTEVCVYAIAHAGQVAALSAYRPTYRAGKGAGIAFVPVSDPAIDRFVATFVAGTGWTGQVSFDLIVQEDGRILPLECNPRATSGIHFFRNPDRFAPAFFGQGAVAPDVIGLQAVKLALLLYGPAQRPVGVWRDLWRAAEVMHWPGDPAPGRQQLAATLEVAGIALRRRISLTAASTFDIEWNG